MLLLVPDGLFSMAENLRYGYEDTGPDYQEAFKLYHRAAGEVPSFDRSARALGGSGSGMVITVCSAHSGARMSPLAHHDGAPIPQLA